MNPFIALQIANGIVQAGSVVAKAFGQHKAHDANATNANNAYLNTIDALNIRGAQETDAAQQSIMQIDRQARSADAYARVSAGESGVAGASVDAVLSDIARQGGDAALTTRRNLSMTLTQLGNNKLGALAERNSRINSVPDASPWMTGLQIGGVGVGTASGIYDFMHPRVGQ